MDETLESDTVESLMNKYEEKEKEEKKDKVVENENLVLDTSEELENSGLV